MRMIKSAHEIALMQLANQVTLAAYEAVHRAIKDGMTQRQVEDLVAAAYGQLGFPGEASVEVGEYSAFPTARHPADNSRRLRHHGR